MIERNNCTKENQAYEGNYIKQLFILTHNAYFHKEIAVRMYPNMNTHLIT